MNTTTNSPAIKNNNNKIANNIMMTKPIDKKWEMINFLKKNNILYGFNTVDVKYCDKKKALKQKGYLKWANGKPYKYPDFNKKKNYYEKHDSILCKVNDENLYTTKTTLANYLVIDTYDIDIIDIDKPLLFKKNKPEIYEKLQNTPYYESRNSIFKENNEYRHYIVNVKNCPDGLRKDIKFGDLLTGQSAWVNLGQELINPDNEIMSIDYIDLLYKKSKKNHSEKIRRSSAKNSDYTIEQLDNLLYLVDDSNFTITKKWKKYMIIIKSLFPKDGYVLFHKHSQRCTDKSIISTDEELKSFYDDFVIDNDHYNPLTINTVVMDAKEKSPIKYIEWSNKWLDDKYKKLNNIYFDVHDRSTHNISKTFYNMFKDKFIYNNKRWYFYNGNYWKYEKEHTTMTKFYSNQFYEFFRYLLYKSNMRQNDKALTEEQREIIQKESELYISVMATITDIKKIIDLIKHSIVHFIKDDEFEFNKMAHILQHKNCVYNLNTHTLEKSNPLHYTSQCTNILITERDENKIKSLNDIFDNIFYNEDENKQLYFEILSTGMYGRSLEKFVLAFGAGRNGKGLINELMEYMLNNNIISGYSYRAKAISFQTESTQGASPEIANLHDKRFVVTSEPEKNKSFNTARIKEITGGDSINARNLFSSNTRTTLRITLISETNSKQKFDNIDIGICDRLVEIPFKSAFYDVETDNPPVFKKNTFFKSSEFKELYAEALFYILCDYWKTYDDRGRKLKIGEKIKERTKQYMIASDELSYWFDDQYINTGNKDDILKMKDVYANYKSGEYYNNLSKKSKNKNNKTWLINELQNNIIYNSFYKIRHSSKKKQYKNIMVSFREKTLEEKGEESNYNDTYGDL